MTNSRVKYFDSLRGIAIIAVVFIHSLTYRDDVFFDKAVFFRQIINFAVPLFLAISGYFLVNKKIETKEEYFSFLKKQIPRVYIPYLIWSVFFVIFQVFVLNSHSMLTMLNNVLIFQSYPIFYYVALVIQYYFLLPFFQVNLKKWLVISVIVSLSMPILITFYKYHFQTTLPLIVYAGSFLTWMVFFILGMFLGRNKLNVNIYILSIGVIISLLCSNIEAYYYNTLFNNVAESVTAVKFSSFIYSGLLIILLLNFKRDWKIFSDLGKVSYAVFLMHMLVMPVVRKLLYLFLKLENSFVVDVLCGIFTIAICYVICVLLRKINASFSQKYFGV